MTALTEFQKQTLAILEPKLDAALKNNDLLLAKNVVIQIKNLLRPTGHEMRLIQSKNRLFEGYMDNGRYDFAIRGFKDIRHTVNKNTRTYLEASILLAICYIRKDDMTAAEPIIREVLKNDKVISSLRRRSAFREAVIQRLDEEGILFATRNQGNDTLDANEIDVEASTIFHLTEDELFDRLGREVPENAITMLLKVDGFSHKQLPSAERTLIAGPIERTDVGKIGKTFFSSIRRVIYNSFCDPKSEIYQAWFNNGIKVFLEKKFVASAVTMAFAGFGIGIKAIAATAVALLTKFGIEVFCDRYKPDGIMELR